MLAPSGGTRFWLRAAIIAACSGLSASSATAQVQPGDVLRVDVFNAPEFSREASVGQDGHIALPLVGRIAVAGLELEAVGGAVGQALQARGLLTRPQIMVEMAMYRPVYVGGSVRKPGAVTFVPGLTARQAVIAAGGLGAPDDTIDPAPETTLASIARRRAVVFQLAQVRARIARLEVEIRGGVDPSDPKIGADAAFLQDRLKRKEQRDQHTAALLDLIEVEIQTLDRQASLHDSEVALQQSDIDDARSLVERGLAPRSRLQELLREMSELNRDRLENRAYHARAQQGAANARYALAETIAADREAARIELAAAQSEQASLMAQLEELDLRIMMAGLAAQDARSGAPDTRLQIYRTNEKEMIAASLDDPLRPGDVLDLTLIFPDPAELGQ